MNITIREIKECDYPEVLSLWNNELDNKMVTAQTISMDYEKMSKNPAYKTFVAVLDDKVVGLIATVEEMAIGLPVGYLKINGLATKEEVQGKGIGKILMKYVEDMAYEKRLSFILLNSGVKRIKAHEFYEKIGYSKDSYCFDKMIKY